MIPGIQQLKIGAKVRWVLIELVVVFLGVYFAFLLNSRKEANDLKKEQQKVYASLKRELEYFRIYFPGMSGYNEKQVNALISQAEVEDSPDFSEWRFTQPQHNYQILEYAITINNSSIIDFELFVSLQTVSNYLQRLENAERQITDIAGNYRSIPEGLKKSSQEYVLRTGDNRIQLRRFIQYMRDRTTNLASSAKAATQALELVNERMGPKFQREIELELIGERIRETGNLDQMVPMILEYFPQYSEEEIRKLVE